MNAQCTDSNPPMPEPKRRRISMAKLFKYLSIVSIAFLAGYIHYHYVSNLFENDRNFSYLSEMERELSLRTEMGFYYSYYKTIVQVHPFMVGLSKLMYDRLVEFPTEVDAFNRFNIYPEVFIGALYRFFQPVLNTTAYRQCHMVDRGGGLTSVESCVGLGQPIVFYLEAVWIMAGLNVAALFFQATAVSESVLGGLLAVIQYFTNHAESTRVQWAPNERENMTAPLLLLQLWLVSLQLRDRGWRKTPLVQVSSFILICLSLLFWQFSQFIFLTQLALFFVMQQLRIINIQILSILLHSHFCGLHTAVLLLQGNDMLKSSLYASLFIVLAIYCLFFGSVSAKIESRMDLLVESWFVFFRIGIVTFSSIFLKKSISYFLDANEDAHVWDLLRSKFTNFRNFHTQLYTCSEVFDFLPMASVIKLCLSLLIPFVLLSIVNVVLASYDAANYKYEIVTDNETTAIERDGDSAKENPETKKDNEIVNTVKNTDLDLINGTLSSEVPQKDELILFLNNLTIDPAVFYNIAQMVVYGVMAGLVMRLKLLFVPQMCVVSAIMMNKKYYILPEKYMKYIPFFWLLCLLPVLHNLKHNVSEELSHVGEFNDHPQEKLMQWITSQSADNVYAGSLPLLASIMLVTRRAVVAHPHYEHENARQRAYAVYKTYGRFSSEELYEELIKLRATHLVVEQKYCYGKSSKGCTFLDLWDAEVGRTKKPALCHTLLRGRTNHLYPVYRDGEYAVFKVHEMSVSYMPRSFDI